MKNDFIKLVMTSKNEFRADASFELCGKSFIKVSVKIDTGCPRTSFPMRTLGISDAEACRMKSADAADKTIRKSISYGVNDTKSKKMEDRQKFRDKKYMELNSVSFEHHMKDLKLAGISMGEFNVKVSYDRVGNILIGMDILKELDVHMGTTKNGKTVLLACPRNCISEEYKKELNNLFDVKTIF